MAISGFLVVDKPRGPTSHDIVARVRRALGKGTRVGHAGTLDPVATGVLVVCVGAATRLAEYATGADKRYLAEVTFGVETDTYDAEGRVVAEQPVDLDRSSVEHAIAAFRGDILQRPPPFSAIQVGGQRMYDLARRGEAVELAERPVTIRSLELVNFAPPRATLDLVCSKGTYVRSLAHDLGSQLGCGAHLSALRRLASGAFTIEQAVPLDQVPDALARDLVLPLDLGVADLRVVRVDGEDVARLRHGLPIGGGDESAEDGALARTHGPDGALVAIVHYKDGAWWPKKVLV